MSFKVSFKTTGLGRLERKAKQLGRRAENRIGRTAISRSTKPFVAEAKARLDSVDTGKFKKTIGRRVRKLKIGWTSIIGPRRHPEIPTNLGLWLEFGTPHRAHKSGKSTGRVAPRPFLRPAIDAKKATFVRLYSEEFRRKLLEEVRRG